MINFPAKLDEPKLLKNTNTLMNFLKAPGQTGTQKILSLNEENEIEVILMPNRGSASFPYAQEKAILLWHWSCLEPYIRRRFNEIKKIPITNLATYYSFNQIFQGLRFLCGEFVQQMEIMYSLLEIQEKKIQDSIDTEWEKTKQDAQSLLFELAAAQKVSLVTIKRFINIGVVENENKQLGFTAVPSVTLTPREFELGQPFKSPLKILANFSINFEIGTPSKIIFSDNITLKFFQLGRMLPALMNAYPAWLPEGELYPHLLQKNLESCVYGPTFTMRSHFQKQPSGRLGFQKADLIVWMGGLYDEFESITLLSFFHCMVEIGYAQQFNRVVFFAPYTFSSKAKAFGFTTNDSEHPTPTEQVTAVNTAIENRTAVTTDDDRFMQLNEDEDELLRPFYFDLKELTDTRVVIPEKRLETTYVKLMNAAKLLDDINYSKGLFPEKFQIPFLPYHTSLTALREREITGKLKPRGVIFGSEELDFRTLADNKALKEIGEMSGLQEPAQNRIRFCRGSS